MHLFNSSILIMISLKITVLYHYVIMNANGVHGQSVSLDPFGTGNITNCTHGGLRASLDRYIFRGKVNATGSNWPKFTNFEIKRTGAPNFVFLCSVSLLTCSSAITLPCYCASNNSGEMYDIIANRSAIVNDSNADIRIQWSDANALNFNTSKELKIPKIYDLKGVTTELTINDKRELCPVTINKDSVFKLKCQNSPSPCQITLFVADNITTQNDEISYTVMVNNNTSIILNFSYSVCGSAAGNFNCNVNITKVNGTTTETTIPTTSNISSSTIATAASTCTLSCKAWGYGLSVVYYINILAIIGAWTVILAFATLHPEKTTVIYGCTGGLCFSALFDIALIIAFALGEPCTCDPGPDSDMLPLWQIMIIIFFICVGVFLIATGVVILRMMHGPKTTPSNSLTTEPISNEPAKPAASTPKNKHKPITQDKEKPVSKENTNTGKFNKGIDFEEKEKTSTNRQNKLAKNATVNENGNPTEVRKLKQKKKRKRDLKEKNESENNVAQKHRPMLSPQNNAESGEIMFVIHSQASTNTKSRPASIEITTNPYLNAK